MKLPKYALLFLTFTVCSLVHTSIYADDDKVSLPRAVHPARVFGSHMVLQCDMPIRVWGSAANGQSVRVDLAGEVLTATANSRGEWSVTFPSRKASSTPVVLKIDTTEYKDILIGEVWICAGQSNMAFALGEASISKTLDGEKSNADLRLLVHRSIPIVAKEGYSKDVLARCNVDNFFQAQWAVSTPKSAKGASAVGWIFGNGLQRRMNVPVGIIQVAVGGSAMNNWLPSVAAQQHPLTASIYKKDWLTNEDVFENHRLRAREALKHVLKKDEPYIVGKTPYRWLCEPDFLFEAGIAPLKGLAFRGVVWYQGESDAWGKSAAEAASELFPFMIKAWRQHLDAGDFPFLFVQLPRYKTKFWPQFREAQRMAEMKVPNTAMAVTIDLGLKDNIHPKDKQPIGERILGLALKHAYGKTDIPTFPTVDRIREDGKDLVITFRECGKGLLLVTGDIPGFEVADNTGVFYAASARRASPDSITVTSPIPTPSELRYGWMPYPDPPLTLFNSDKLPLGPFLMKIDRESK